MRDCLFLYVFIFQIQATTFSANTMILLSFTSTTPPSTTSDCFPSVVVNEIDPFARADTSGA